MDPNHFFELIKNLYSVLKCPSCGEVYQLEEIQFVGHFDGLFLMQMNCKKCKLPVSVNLYAKDMATEFSSDLTMKDLDYAMIDMNPIETDEVISFHQDLKTFRGDIKKILKKK